MFMSLLVSEYQEIPRLLYLNHALPSYFYLVTRLYVQGRTEIRFPLTEKGRERYRLELDYKGSVI